MPKTSEKAGTNPLADLLRGKPFGVPLHSQLVHFPIALFSISLILDFASYFGHGSFHLVRAAWFMLLGGEAMAILALITGFADWTSIRDDHRAKNIGAWHMGINGVALAMFGIGIFARYRKLDWQKTDVALCVLSAGALGLIFAGGYLGGMMVYDDGIGVGRHRRRGQPPLRTIPLSAADSPDGYVTIPGAELMPNGKTLRLDIEGRVIALAKVDGEYFAFQDFCTHRCGPLSEGSFHNGQVMCPWHRSCFDMSTGQVIHGPAKVPIQTYPVSIIDGQVRINMQDVRPATSPRAAETMARLSERPWKLQESELERRRAANGETETAEAKRGAEAR